MCLGQDLRGRDPEVVRFTGVRCDRKQPRALNLDLLQLLLTSHNGTLSFVFSRPTSGGFILGEAWSFSGLTSKIQPLHFMLKFDADVKQSTTRHQCENRCACLQEILTEKGYSEEQVREYFQRHDLNGDGRLDYAEFTSFYDVPIFAR